MVQWTCDICGGRICRSPSIVSRKIQCREGSNCTQGVMYLEVVEKGSRQVSDKSDMAVPRCPRTREVGKEKGMVQSGDRGEGRSTKQKRHYKKESGDRLARGSPQSNEKVDATARTLTRCVKTAKTISPFPCHEAVGQLQRGSPQATVPRSWRLTITAHCTSKTRRLPHGEAQRQGDWYTCTRGSLPPGTPYPGQAFEPRCSCTGGH